MCFSTQDQAEIERFLRAHLHHPVQMHTYARQKSLRDHFVSCDTHSEPVRRFAADIARLSPLLHVAHNRVRGLEDIPGEAAIKWLPAIRIIGEIDHHIRYYGLPMGYEVTAFLRALALTSGAPLTIHAHTQAAVKAIATP
ncbi:MAG: hypothetical protein KF690_10405, partial [Bacteroidetes bacterium]|nr:hypothetical protein [Bacteroidota bacterium]